MKTILYFYPIMTSFVQSDLDMLSDGYRIKSFHFNGTRKIGTPFQFLKQIWFLMLHLPGSHALLSQFSGYHSFLPALAGKFSGKPHATILHGTECNNFPEYHYGYKMRPLLFWYSKKSMQWSTKLFPVSDALVSADYTYMDTVYKKQGFKNFYKNVSTPYEVIYNGVDIERFSIISQERDPRSFITVAAGINSPGRRAIKGVDLVIELARITPENNYTIIGASGPLEIDLPSNVNVIGFVPHEELVDYYNRHAFYLQLSTSEGFVIAVCEAMLCGCVPIVSKVGASPFIAGETGYVLERKDLLLLHQLINDAVAQYSPGDMFPPRDYIATNFSKQIRKQKLLSAMDLLTTGTTASV